MGHSLKKIAIIDLQHLLLMATLLLLTMLDMIMMVSMFIMTVLLSR